MKIIDIKALEFNYNDSKVFENFNLSIKESSFTTIVGNNGSGKTTLIKLLLGFEKSLGINIFGKPLNGNIRNVRNQIGVILEEPSVFFAFDTVKKEIEFSMLNLNLSISEKKSKFQKVVKELKIEHLLELNPMDISLEEQYLVALATCLVSNFKIIIIDNILSKVNMGIVKKALLNANKAGITIINFTTNSEEIFLGNYTIFINQGKVIFYGSNKKLLNHLDVFKKLKMDLPFVIDLSEKLMFYNLIDKKYTNMEKLVDDIWK